MANVPISNLTTTWNNVSTTFTGIKLNVTDTASAAGSLLIDLQVGGTSRFSLGKGGAATFAGNAAASTPPVVITGTWFTGGTSTTTKPQVLIEPTGTTSTAFSTAGTGFGVNAASGFAGNLLDLQVNGGRHFRVASTGSGSFAEIYVQAGFTNEGLSIGASNSSPKTKLSFSDGLFFTGASDYDVCLRADGVANTIALRRTTNAQTFRLYGTYTDVSNYRRLVQTMSAGGVAEIKPEGAGTGASGNVLHISGLPTSNPGPGILWNNLGIVNVGT
jgi:hypothetical protein